jgi:hypothetical protein
MISTEELGRGLGDEFALMPSAIQFDPAGWRSPLPPAIVVAP